LYQVTVHKNYPEMPPIELLHAWPRLILDCGGLLANGLTSIANALVNCVFIFIWRSTHYGFWVSAQIKIWRTEVNVLLVCTSKTVYGHIFLHFFSVLLWGTPCCIFSKHIRDVLYTYICIFSPYRTVNTFSVSCKNQSFNAAQGSTRSLFWEQYKVPKYNRVGRM
jgi:hypothetical protein